MRNNTIPPIENQTILFCVLNWGLGHATRSISLIEELSKNNNVLIASDGNALSLLKQEFPSLPTIEMPSFKIQYASKFMFINLIRIFFQILQSAKQNRYFIEVIEKRLPFDLIISDNRFGCWSKKAKSIYITHQIWIKLPTFIKFLEPLGCWYHRKMIKKHDECWIPDYKNENESLAGELSHRCKLKTKTIFTGPLSRFEKQEKVSSFAYDFCVILSGPEPKRTVLEKTVLEKFSAAHQKTIVVRGIANENMQFGYGNLQVYSHLSAHSLQTKIITSKYVIARAGYTSIMDLHKLQKKAVLIPTPQQPEQEYLAKHMQHHRNFIIISETEFQEKTVDELLQLFDN